MDITGWDVLIFAGIVGGFLLLVIVLLLDRRYRRTTIKWSLDVERRRQDDHPRDEDPPDP